MRHIRGRSRNASDRNTRSQVPNGICLHAWVVKAGIGPPIVESLTFRAPVGTTVIARELFLRKTETPNSKPSSAIMMEVDYPVHFSLTTMGGQFLGIDLLTMLRT
jgi:hypothetical protein